MTIEQLETGKKMLEQIEILNYRLEQLAEECFRLGIPQSMLARHQTEIRAFLEEELAAKHSAFLAL